MIALSTSPHIRRVSLHYRSGTNPAGRKQRFFAICEESSLCPVRIHANVVPSWTDAKDRRRCALIDRSLHEELTAAENRELTDLQSQAEAYFDAVAPPPIEGALRLHAQLTKLAGSQSE